MKDRHGRWSLGGLRAAVLAAYVLTGPAGAADPVTPPDHHGETGAEHSFRKGMDESMARMMRGMHAPRYTGNADIDFLAMTVAHHVGAIDMARLVLQHGEDPATRQLAEEIIATQTVEIESMQRRLAMLRASSSGRPAEFPALGGVRGP